MKMSTSKSRDLFLFAGQGSNQHLLESKSGEELGALLGGKQKHAFDKFLYLCQQAYHAEVDSITLEEGSILGEEILRLSLDSTALFNQAENTHSHPVVEALSLYVRQILELMIFESRNYCHHVVEASGICTGILPAILAVSFASYDSHKFVEAAVSGFRLAFWIGLRAATHYRRVIGDSWRDDPAVISIFGISEETLESNLASCVTSPEVKISAIFSEENISLSGPGNTLKELKFNFAEESIQCRWAHVHALFHRGTEMEYVLRQILADADKRAITFPDWASLHAPIRSATSGLIMDSGMSAHSPCLLETALRSIFIERVNWPKAATQIQSRVSTSVNSDDGTNFRILGFGPGSRSLFPFARDLVPLPGVNVVENFIDSLHNLDADDIAIVGLSVNFPEAKGQDQFWDILENGRSTVTEIPALRFDTSHIHGAKHANFLQNAFDFDATYFNISPREANSMDPQQRLLLQAALEALDDAGYVPNATPTFQTSTMAVYVGAATGDYVDNLRDGIDVYYSPGTLRAFLAGRISYTFGLSGPSMVIDTACSSSLVALHHACIALKSGGCTAAIVGGVNTITSPDMYNGLARAHFLSPTGQCKPFDERADGYCRAEGSGVIVVKKLCHAIEEGDHIYGVIRGIGVNQCGTAKSITHPDPETQAALMKSVLRQSRLRPDSIDVVEAHGTGTQAGDYAELSSIASVFAPRSSTSPLYVSSLKGNIGHSEAASGIAGLAKILMMMKQKKIPPQASFSRLNPRLQGFVDCGLAIPTNISTWSQGNARAPRRAVLNNFGASGSNAALVVEEFVDTKIRGREPLNIRQTSPRSHHLLNLSAKSERALELLRHRYISYLNRRSEISLENLCYTASVKRREYWPHRISIIGSSRDELLKGLGALPHDTLHSDSKHKSVFVFSGQGNIYMGMGADLLATVPLFRETVNQCDKILSQHGYPEVGPFIADSHQKSDLYQKEEDIIVAQCACFVLEHALANVLIHWGMKPQIVIGHSIGEYAAFTTAGVLDLKDALLLLAKRARLMAQKCVPQSSGMVACKLSAAEVNSLLCERPSEFDTMTLACINGPADVVVAGAPVSLARFVQYCKGNGVRHKRLDVIFGFHSPAMDPILGELSQAAQITQVRPAKIQIGSSLYGRLLDIGELIEPDYFIRHTREPVNFHGVADHIARTMDDYRLTIVEVGPSPSTESMWKQVMVNRSYTFLASLSPAQAAWATLANVLRRFFLQNHHIHWKNVYNASNSRFIPSLPGHPLIATSYFTPYKERRFEKDSVAVSKKSKDKPNFAFLSPKNSATSVSEHGLFRTQMMQISMFINAHKVGGVALCPASVYLEIVMQALTEKNNTDPLHSIYVFQNVTFEHPLVHSQESSTTNRVEVHTKLTSKVTTAVNFTATTNQNNAHCTGQVSILGTGTQTLDVTLARRQARAQRLQSSFSAVSGRPLETLSAKTIYRTIFPRVVKYGEPFLTLQHLTIKSSGLEGRGTFHLARPQHENHGKFVSSPVFVDTLLHAAGFIANTYVDSEIACICTAIEQALIPCWSSIPSDRDLDVYCTLVDVGHTIIADSYAIDADGKIVGSVEGMSFKKIRLKSFKALLSRAASDAFGVSGGSDIKVPITPSIKISRPAEESGRQSEITGSVRSIIREVSGIDYEPTDNMVLSQIGIDSLLLIELADILAQRFRHVKFPVAELQACQSVADLIRTMSEKHSPVSMSSSEIPSLESISTASSAPSTSGFECQSPELISDESRESSSGSLMASLFLDICGLGLAEEDHGRLLSSLGVDSHLSIELCQAIRERFDVSVEHESISNLTYKQLDALISAKTCSHDARVSSGELKEVSSQDNIPCYKTLLHLQKGAPEDHPNKPLYMFHDGSGTCGLYSRLGALARDLYGISDKSLHPSIQTMEGLAKHYIDRARLSDQNGILLGGWSFGGVLAFEVSRQLRHSGIDVKGVILIDSPVPVDHEALPREIINWVLERRGGLIGSEASNAMRDHVTDHFRRYSTMLQAYRPSRLDSQVDVPCVMLRCSQTIDTETVCGVPYPWLNSQVASKESIAKWEDLTQHKIPVLDLDCNHFDPFDFSHVVEVTQKLKKACRMLDDGIMFTAVMAA